MDITHIKEGKGFYCPVKLLKIMSKVRPPRGDYHRLKKTTKSGFATIGIMAYGAAFMPLGQIYAGNKELYEFVKEEFLRLASGMAFDAKADEWKEATS
jgi:hypothetical protein